MDVIFDPAKRLKFSASLIVGVSLIDVELLFVAVLLLIKSMDSIVLVCRYSFLFSSAKSKDCSAPERSRRVFARILEVEGWFLSVAEGWLLGS